MLPALTTPRLLLRPWTEADIDVLHHLWTDVGVRRFLWENTVITHGRAAEAVRSMTGDGAPHGIGGWLIDLRESAATAGFAGFRFMPDRSAGEIELLYGLDPRFWGRGLATEASRALLRHLWRATSFNRVYARTDMPNAKSIEVMRRLGMKKESAADGMVVYALDRPPGHRPARVC
jgi:[ribosomal protein S5]-alanine N-acetyltransferase